MSSLQIWRQFERLARESEACVNNRLVAYFRGESTAAPSPAEQALAKHAREVANRHLMSVLGKSPRRKSRASR